ncbi:MAG: hypothetical protein M3Z95_06850 [Actinomycetota bacterium]|nr:hypothetical protein [Actinomycetota bacterium]
MAGAEVELVPVDGAAELDGAAVLAAALDAVWLLDVELLLLPHPARTTPAASAVRRDLDSFTVMLCSFI